MSTAMGLFFIYFFYIFFLLFAMNYLSKLIHLSIWNLQIRFRPCTGLLAEYNTFSLAFGNPGLLQNLGAITQQIGQQPENVAGTVGPLNQKIWGPNPI